MKRFLSILLVTIMIFSLAGCSQNTAQQSNIAENETATQETTNEATSEAAMDTSKEELLPTLKIGVMSDVGAIPFIIAKENGYFASRNLPLEITVFRSALDRDTALQTGNLQGAMADMLTILFYNESGFGAKMIGQTYGNYKMITSPNLNEADFLALDKLSIGLSSNTVIDFATEKIADSKAFTNKLEKVAIPQMPVRLEMLKAGELQGATLPDPLASAAVLEGGVMVGSTEEFGLYPGIFIASDLAIADHGKSLELMYEAYNEAVDYLNTTPSSEYFDLLISELGFPPILADQFEMPTFKHVEAPDQDTFDVTLKWMQQNSLVQNDFDYNTLSDLTHIPNN